MPENEKKKPDYTNSAENLCNPPEIGEALKELHLVQENIVRLDNLLRDNEEYKALKSETDLAEAIKARLKDMIDAQGSYQYIDAGLYAVKYRRMSKSYHVEPFLAHFSKYASAVVEQTINAKALEGLVKGGLITEDELKKSEVLTETPTYAYYIR